MIHPPLPNPGFLVVDLAIPTAQTESSQPAQRHNAPALFAVLVSPYGFTGAVTGGLMPYLLRKNGMAVDQIATIVAIALLPQVWSFLWSPLADVGFRRRSWLLVSAIGAGLAATSAILNTRFASCSYGAAVPDECLW